MTTFSQLERQKAEMLARVSAWSPVRLAYAPSADAWSAAQVFDHLARTEASILTVVRHNLGSPHRTTLRDRLGVLFLERVFRSDRKVKVPASAKQILPGNEVDFGTMLTRWEETRRALQVLLAEAPPPAAKNGGVFRHPVGGWMTLPQVLSFFSVHLVHHGFQLAQLEQTSRRQMEQLL